jgi:dedicator of cytokinesis protein 3
LRSGDVANTSQYQSSIYEQSLKRSMSTSSTNRQPFSIPPLQMNRPILTPPPLSPQSPRDDIHMASEGMSSKTPLQRHLAHLARHGINGVSSGPRENGGSDSLSAESAHQSFVHVGNSVQSVLNTPASGASVNLGSIGSIKGRFSRFGSLRLGLRRGP